MADIAFIDAAIDDLRRLGPGVVPRFLRKVLVLLDDPEAGHPLGGPPTHTAGVPAEKVAALGLEQAVDLWTAFMAAAQASGDW